jgi:hypothetical protein
MDNSQSEIDCFICKKTSKEAELQVSPCLCKTLYACDTCLDTLIENSAPEYICKTCNRKYDIIVDHIIPIGNEYNINCNINFSCSLIVFICTIAPLLLFLSLAIGLFMFSFIHPSVEYNSEHFSLLLLYGSIPILGFCLIFMIYFKICKHTRLEPSRAIRPI